MHCSRLQSSAGLGREETRRLNKWWPSVISANVSSLDKSSQGAWRMLQVGTHSWTTESISGLTKELRLASPAAQQIDTATAKLESASTGCLGAAGLAAGVTCTRSTHVYRAPTVSQARRQGDHSGGPQERVSGFSPVACTGLGGLPTRRL